jgi:hypothetical protein
LQDDRQGLRLRLFSAAIGAQTTRELNASRKAVLMKKSDLVLLRRQRARELAGSGDYRNWHEVEAILRREGFGAVPDDRFFRDELDVICQRATGKPAYVAFVRSNGVAN